MKHVPQAEVIVEQESSRFMADWERRRNGPVIARLNQEFETKRKSVVTNLLSKLNGKLSKEDKDYIEGAFRLLQNQFLHGPISALAEEMQKVTLLIIRLLMPCVNCFVCKINNQVSHG